MPALQDLQMFKSEGSMILQRLLPPERRLPPAEADSAKEVPPTVTATAALAAALPRKTGSQAPLSDGGGRSGSRGDSEEGGRSAAAPYLARLAAAAAG